MDVEVPLPHSLVPMGPCVESRGRKDMMFSYDTGLSTTPRLGLRFWFVLFLKE
jgi:hypothetical protein